MLFEEYDLGSIKLHNRVVMAPMTRSRAIDNIPNDLMAEYYGQRAGAGLIITEGTAPCANALGYPRIPGAFSPQQTEGWKKVTEAVHKGGAKIFLQLMHTGRVGHPANMPKGAELVSTTTVAVSGEMYTDSSGPQPYPGARLMEQKDIEQAQQEHVKAAKNAIEAGFDGVELHAANGYLLEQFLNANVNQLKGNYNGSKENRARFVLETAKAVGEAIGFAKVGIRVSPYGVFNDTGAFEGVEEAYEYLAKELGKLGLAYLHVVDHEAMGAPAVPQSVKDKMREAFGGTFILSGGYEKARAEKELQAGKGHLVAFGRPFIANPDLVHRMKENAPVADPDQDTFYTPGKEGYTDYPTLQEQKA